MNFSEGNPVANDFMSVLGTQLEILTSEELRERAMIKLRLEQPGATIRPELSARLLPRTTIFDLTSTSGTPAHVQRYLDLIMEEYIAMRREQRLFSSRSVMDQISSEIARLEKILNEQESELFRFKQQRNIVFWEQQSSTAARFLSQLKNREASLRMQIKLAELLDQGAAKESLAKRSSALELAESGEATRPRTPGALNSSGPLAAQKIRLRELELELESAALVFLPKHPKYQKLEGEFFRLRRLVALLEQENTSAFRAEVEGMRSELSTILSSMGEWDETVRESTQIDAEHQKLQSTTARTRELYQRLVGSLQNIDFRKGVDDEVIQVLKRASLAAEIRPDAVGPLRTGSVVGLLAGIGLLMLAGKMDQRMFAVAELEALGIEVKAEIPLVKRLRGDSLTIADSKSEGLFSESIRSLRAALSLETVNGGGSRVVVICSSTAAEGKSTVTLNLALSAAAAGLRTLVIDADMRRGSIGDRLKLERDTPGLSDFLRSGGHWRDFVRPAGGRGFSVMTRGANSVEIIDAMMFTIPPSLTTEAKQEYDLVIIDSAPIMPVSDTIPLLGLADHVIFMVKLRGASVSAVTKALAVVKRSAKVPPLVVANGVRPTEGAYNYGYYSYQSR
jgi:Mrp family chromosome partitioning ATPase/uncharacterized protein involved in exopolysaccharide biosynthesis